MKNNNEEKSLKFIAIRFDKSDEIVNFLLKHKNLELYDKTNRKFLVVETENDYSPKYKKKIVARFTCKDDKLIIATLDRYKSLSDNAKAIIDSIEYTEDKSIIIQIGKSIEGILIDKDLYYEIFYFITDVGLTYCRGDRGNGEQLEICLNSDGILQFQ